MRSLNWSCCRPCKPLQAMHFLRMTQRICCPPLARRPRCNIGLNLGKRFVRMTVVPYYIRTMSIEDLEKAVAGLPPDQYAEFRAWFEAFEADRFDRKIERDAQAGKLDRLADAAIDDFHKCPAREL